MSVAHMGVRGGDRQGPGTRTAEATRGLALAQSPQQDTGTGHRAPRGVGEGHRDRRPGLVSGQEAALPQTSATPTRRAAARRRPPAPSQELGGRPGHCRQTPPPRQVLVWGPPGPESQRSGAPASGGPAGPTRKQACWAPQFGCGLPQTSGLGSIWCPGRGTEAPLRADAPPSGRSGGRRLRQLGLG